MDQRIKCQHSGAIPSGSAVDFTAFFPQRDISSVGEQHFISGLGQIVILPD